MYEFALIDPANLLMGVLVGAPRAERTETRATTERNAARMAIEQVEKVGLLT